MQKIKVMRKLIICATLVTSSILMAQNQGTIVYEVKIEGLPPEQASMMGDMEMKVIWKDDKAYVEQTSMMYNIKSVTINSVTTTLFDMMGNKYFTRITPKDITTDDKEKDQPDYKVEYTNETKTIAGYDCKKAIVTVKNKDGKENKFDVWYTDKIPNQYFRSKHNQKKSPQYLQDIKGMPLEYSVSGGGSMLIVFTTKEVNFNPVSDDTFKISTEGYTEMKPEDFQKMGAGVR